MGLSAASPHVLGSLLYFFLFMARGCITPFLPLVWQGKGLSREYLASCSKGFDGYLSYARTRVWAPRVSAAAGPSALRNRRHMS